MSEDLEALQENLEVVRRPPKGAGGEAQPPEQEAPNQGLKYGLFQPLTLKQMGPALEHAGPWKPFQTSQ